MTTTNVIDNTADTIDSRDVIARIDYLTSERDALGLDTDETAELDALETLADDAAGFIPDWQYGETLIRDSYFEDYARELAEDIGAVPTDASWPAYCIDWEHAARDLQMDYTSFEFDGVTYWAR